MMYFENKIYKLLNEEDVMDKMIKFKDADGNEKEATVGGILKKGADHPAHDLAQKELDNAKGDGEDQPKSGPSIDVNPFDDKEKEAPKKPATTHTDKKFKKKAVPIMNDILDDVIDNYDGNFDQWMETGATQLPGDIDDALGELEAMSNADEVDKFKEKAYARIQQYVTDQGYDQGVEDEPSAASSDDNIDNFWKDLEQGKLKDVDWDDEEGQDDSNPTDDALDTAIETIADAGERGAGWDNPDVKRKVSSDFEELKKAGGTVDDIAQSLQSQAEYLNPEDLELADAAAEAIFGEPVPHGLSPDDVGTEYQDESKQPFRENYNRLFKGRDVL